MIVDGYGCHTALHCGVKAKENQNKVPTLYWLPKLNSFMFLFCLVFAMSLCASVYMCFVVTCWERADLLARVCGV